MALRTGSAPAFKRWPSVALEQLGRDIVDAIFSADVVHDHDVRVVERGRGASFLFEPAQSIGVVLRVIRQHLERDIPVQPRIAGTKHFTHPARADGSDDVVGTESCAGSDHAFTCCGSTVVRDYRAITHQASAQIGSESEQTQR
jgi:hypothetical protein